MANGRVDFAIAHRGHKQVLCVVEVKHHASETSSFPQLIAGMYTVLKSCLAVHNALPSPQTSMCFGISTDYATWVTFRSTLQRLPSGSLTMFKVQKATVAQNLSFAPTTKEGKARVLSLLGKVLSFFSVIHAWSASDVNVGKTGNKGAGKARKT
ncbi:hypothetical protein BC939DRAFT_466070 [Gamsiella multidivaricata]|uniref:uncharacterized protein n=1 Tax=Gamsiella multidivaricata TaxID=101098 RepID=UPI00221F4DBD|nr:uncharacterized protein BC939DRAFT_466070 [Gamsiella multidivaricata]KAI7817412.1 hypothetical protein BC939DRAFT_466070 [Gamsiella multidivaricata]